MAEIDGGQSHKLHSLARKLGLSPQAVKASELVVTGMLRDTRSGRGITLDFGPPPGTESLVRLEPLDGSTTTQTRSIKVSNLIQADLGSLLETVAGGILLGADVAAEPHPLLIAAGLIILIRSVTHAMTVQLMEREASVYWGLIRACDPKTKTAALDSIKIWTNQVRKDSGLPPLGEAEILLSLKILTRIKCISPTRQQPGSWRLRERWWTTTHTRAARRRLDLLY